MNPIENLWRKVTLEIVNSIESDNQTQVNRVAHGRLEPVSHPRPLGLGQAVHSIQTRCRKTMRACEVTLMKHIKPEMKLKVTFNILL